MINLCLRRLFLAMLAIGALASPSLGQSNYVWKNVKVIAGGYVPGIVFSPKQPGLAYCRTDIGSFYKWDNAIKQWKPLCDWCGVSNLMGGESVAADPLDANVVYLAAGMGTNQRAAIMRSRDQGKTFDVIDVPFGMGGNSDGRSVGERLAIDPDSTNVLYFASRQNGLWKSEDFAGTWKRVESFPAVAVGGNNGGGAGAGRGAATGSAQNGGTGQGAAAGTGLAAGGQDSSNGAARGPAAGAGQNPSTRPAGGAGAGGAGAGAAGAGGASGRGFRGGGGGGNFQRGAGLSFVVFDPSSSVSGSPSKTIYVGSANAGQDHLFRSTDAGQTWEAVPGQPQALLALKAEMDSRGILYVTYGNGAGPNGITSGAVWRFDSKAGSWTDITPIPRTGFCGVSVDRQHPGTLIVTTLDHWSPGDDVLRTTDDGKTWKSLRGTAVMDISLSPYMNFGARSPKFGWWTSALALDPFDSNHAMYGTGATIFGTHDLTDIDAGKPTKWSVEADGMEETAIICLISPTDGAHLISGFGDIGGFVHDDLDVSPAGGMFSRPVFTNTDALYCADLNPKVVVRVGRGGGGSMAISQDGGHTWQPLAAPRAAGAPPAPGRGGGGGGGGPEGTLLLSADASTLLYDAGTPEFSTDKGANWTPVKGLPGNLKLVADRVNPKKFYALDAGGAKVFTSTDGGESFDASPAVGLDAGGGGRGRGNGGGGGGRVWTTLGVEGDIWIAGNRLLHSTDGGKTFKPLAKAPQIAGGGLCFGFGKAAPGKNYPALYAAGNFNGVNAIFRSDDVGESWVRINDDQHQYGTRFRCLCGDPRVYGRVYVGTDGRGIVYGDIAN
jgi:hypothetical protein